MDVIIRPLIPDDEASLREALYYAIHVPPGETPPVPEIVDVPELACYVTGWMQHPDDLGVLAEKNETPIGAAWLRRWSGEQRGYGYVDEATPELSMSLLPEHRGRGVGTALLRRLMSLAAERFAAVSLSVSVSNPAKRLYEREGFEAVGEPKGSSVTMVRVLSTGNAVTPATAAGEGVSPLGQTVCTSPSVWRPFGSDARKPFVACLNRYTVPSTSDLSVTEHETVVRSATEDDFAFVSQDGYLPDAIVRRKVADGDALLARTEAELASQGHAALFSSSQAEEPEPQAWPRRVGFEECGLLAGLNEGGVGEVFFRKALDPTSGAV